MTKIGDLIQLHGPPPPSTQQRLLLSSGQLPSSFSGSGLLHPPVDGQASCGALPAPAHSCSLWVSLCVPAGLERQLSCPKPWLQEQGLIGALGMYDLCAAVCQPDPQLQLQHL